jgi:hypothetical protein
VEDVEREGVRKGRGKGCMLIRDWRKEEGNNGACM